MIYKEIDKTGKIADEALDLSESVVTYNHQLIEKNAKLAEIGYNLLDKVKKYRDVFKKITEISIDGYFGTPLEKMEALDTIHDLCLEFIEMNLPSDPSQK